MALSVYSWHSIRLSAHGSWPRGAGPAPGARRSATWNFENFTNSWTYSWSFLGPWTPYLWLFLYQKTSQNIRKYMWTSWKHIIFPYITINIFGKKRKANPQFVWKLFCVCFLIEMKFISKLWWCLVVEMQHFSILIFTKLFWRSILKKYIQK